jgi:hypothetical protein
VEANEKVLIPTEDILQQAENPEVKTKGDVHEIIT